MAVELQIDPKQVRPYYDALGDGIVQISFTLPLAEGPQAEAAARETLRRMNLTDVSIVERKGIAPGFTFFVAYGHTSFSVDATALESDVAIRVPSPQEIERLAHSIGRRLVVVGATLESDAHTVGLDAIFNAKGFAGHHGLESYPCFRAVNMGAQIPFRTLVEALLREKADALLLSQTITHKSLHLRNLTRLVDLLEAEGLRSKLILVVGGPLITSELAQELGYDAGFGKGAFPQHAADFIVREYLRRNP